MYKKIVYSGKIFENKLVNYPQFLLCNKNNYYELFVGNNSLILKIQLTNNNAQMTLPICSVQYQYECKILWRR